MALLDGVRVALVSISGAGPELINLGLPVAGFRTVDQAGGVDGTVYSWVIEANFDNLGNAVAREGGTGAWDESGNFIERNTVWSTEANGTDPITMTGDGHVIITPLAQDFVLDADLISWAQVARAAGFDAFTADPSWTNFLTLVTGEPTFYTVGGTDVAIADGGTGQSTAVAGFDALSPTTTRGDLIARSATNNVRLPAGTLGQVLTMGADDPAWAPPREFINVKRDHGAVADGVTDDTDAINAAFTEASETGRAVYFPGSAVNGVPVPYMVSTITIPGWSSTAQTQIRVFGDGFSSQIKQLADYDDLNILIVGNLAGTATTADISIENLSFAAAGPKTAGAAIYANFAHRLNIDRIFMLDTNMFYGLYVSDVDNVTVKRVFIYNCISTGMAFASDYPEAGSSGAGLYIDETCVIAKLDTPDGHCINIGGGLGGVWIEAVMYGGTAGVFIAKNIFNVYNREVWLGQKCVCDHTGDYGVFVAEDSIGFLQINGVYAGGSVSIYIADQGTPTAPSHPTSYVAIDNAWLPGSIATDSIGIWYEGNGHFRVSDCFIHHYDSHGIFLSPESTAMIQILGNHIADCGGDGINQNATPTYEIISENIVQGNAGTIVGVTPSATVLVSNNITV